MSRRGTRLLAGAAALLVAALGVLWWSQRPDAETAAATAPPSSLAATPLQWRAGTAQQYDVRVDSVMHMALGDSAQRIPVSLAGVLETFTLSADAVSAQVGMRMASIDLRIGEGRDADTNRALTTPFRVRFAAGGMPEAFEFPAGLGIQERRILENLVRMFQVTMQDGATWEAREANASGSYQATYRRSDATTVQKAKGGFVAHASTPTYEGADIHSSETLRIEPRHDWLTAMQVEETIRTPGEDGPALQVVNKASLALRQTARAATDDEAAASAWRFAAAEAPPAEPAAAATLALSTGQARQQILRTLAQLDGARSGRLPLIHRLRDLLRVDGSLPGELWRAMQSMPLTDRTRADLYLAFELAGTESAQAVLTAVVADPAAPLKDGMRALVALSGVREPGGATLAALSTAAQGATSTDHGRHLASTAAFTLGNVGKTLRSADDPGYAAVRSQLLGGALGGSGTDRRATFVHALGNTRDASLVPQVTGLLDDPAADVRRAAALSLGMLDANQAAKPLLDRFVREPDSEVRGAIAESLVNWEAPTAQAADAMRRQLPGEQDENARYQMARFLGENLDRFPENRPVLQQLLRSEQSKRIRQDVAEALAAPPQP